VDVSVVVPSHNGSSRLPTTLAHIAAQAPPPGLAWELVLVDNASTDGTAQAAAAAWPRDAPAPLRVVREPRLGLRHAHLRGFAEARGELITWIEDDNWIAPDWLEVAASIMRAHPEAGACGGVNEPVCEVAPRAWFERFQFAYACGPQGPTAGDVTTSRGHLWGAGLTVRRAAWDQLVADGFRPLVADRRGSADFNSGGDSEICFALHLTGWRLRFEPGLRLQHFLAAHRLDWWYLRRMFRGFGASTVGFDPYYRAIDGGRVEGRRLVWADEARRMAAALGRRPRKVWDSWRRPGEGDRDVLDVEWELGRLGELLRRREAYDRSLRDVERAGWRQRATDAGGITSARGTACWPKHP
jgi:glycosyltransferase involved in cell wall biosynthesis